MLPTNRKEACIKYAEEAGARAWANGKLLVPGLKSEPTQQQEVVAKTGPFLSGVERCKHFKAGTVSNSDGKFGILGKRLAVFVDNEEFQLRAVAMAEKYREKYQVIVVACCVLAFLCLFSVLCASVSVCS